MLLMVKGTVKLFFIPTLAVETDVVFTTVFGMNTLDGARDTGGGETFLVFRRMNRATEGTPAELIANSM